MELPKILKVPRGRNQCDFELVKDPNGQWWRYDKRDMKYVRYDVLDNVAGTVVRYELPEKIDAPFGLTADGRPRKRSANEFAGGLSKERRAKLEAERKTKLRRLKDKERAEKRKLERLEREIEKGKEVKELLDSAPTPAERQKAISALFVAHDFDPVEELIEMVQHKKGKSALPPKERAVILKELLSYVAPKPKSIEISGKVDHGVQLSMVDFTSVTQAAMKSIEAEEIEEEVMELTDSEYDEFLD